MNHGTISAGYSKALLDYAVAQGIDRHQLLERCGLVAANLAEQESRVPLSNHLALYRASIELSGDPALALHFGEATDMPSISILGLIGASCATVGESRLQLNRYMRLAMDPGDLGVTPLLEIARNRQGVWMVFTGDAYREHPHLIEASMAQSICGARRLLSTTVYFREREFPRAVHFTHPAPTYRAEYDRIFNVPIVFDADRNAMLIDDDFLAIPIPRANQYLFGVLSRQADELLKKLQEAKTFRGRVEAQLIPVLHKGAISIEHVAANMAMSRHTLFRRLKAEGVTFTELVDKLRQRMALHYLHEKKVAVMEVAYLVGFSDTAAFSRAFKRWTGKNPGASRGVRSG